MANFSKLSELLNTTDGMTVLRNNSAQDDGVDTVTGVDWFTFNGVTASKLYVSGNSFVGFGSNAEHLKICRRDGKMWYLYRQEGIIGNVRFLKIRWQGYTWYSQTSATYALIWELFLFDDGGMYLNIVTVPSDSSYLGTNQLICGSKTYNFKVAVSTPVDYSFLPDGSGQYVLSEEEYPVLKLHAPSGYIEFSTALLQGVSELAGSKITWVENVPNGTSLSVYARVSSTEYELCTNGGDIPGVSPGVDYSIETLFVKVEMETTDPLSTPTLSNLFIQLLNAGDDHVIVLCFDPGNVNSIQNAIGDVQVSYDGSGDLKGVGGPVLAFESAFTPTGLLSKNNPAMYEHISILSVESSPRLLRVYYNNVKMDEHLEFAEITSSCQLIHIEDI